jgi:CHAT domain-containing protein
MDNKRRLSPASELTLQSRNKSPKDFDTAIHYYRTLLTQPDRNDELIAFSHLLYELLIEPVSQELKGKNNLTILPDGILSFLPFETLLDSKNLYMAENYTLRYSQSISISSILRKRDYSDRDRKPILALGGAVYEEVFKKTDAIANSQQLAVLQKEIDFNLEKNLSVRGAYMQLGVASWPNLPGTLSEVNQIAEIFNEADILTGDKVTENIIKDYSKTGALAEYKVLHFATHGLVVPEIPELSALVLSQPNNNKTEDGYLRMAEIAELDLAADFVNLSACETGLGKIYGGEGVVGLTQAFLIAGANGLSVSLWQVSDDSTSKFMTEVYKLVNKTRMPYKQAFAKVKRAFIKGTYGKRWRSPYYWSPFVYYGN